MKLRNHKTALLLSLGFFLIWTSCKKYEEGPAFTLRTAKARITGEWKYEKYVIDGQELNENITITFKKDANVSYHNADISEIKNGGWDFGSRLHHSGLEEESLEKITISWVINNKEVELEEYDIIKLTNKEMRLKMIKDKTGSTYGNKSNMEIELRKL